MRIGALPLCDETASDQAVGGVTAQYNVSKSKNPHKDKISLINKAVGKDHTFDSNIMMLQSKDHINVENITLTEAISIAKRLSINSKRIAIKSDCEDGEYEIFTKDCDFSDVCTIQIEYHHGKKNIPHILKSKGFKVHSTHAIKSPAGCDIGYIYAYK